MIMSLRESKAKLSDLVERASQGEEILITVRGKAKLVGVSSTKRSEDKQAWIEEQRTLQKTYSTGKSGPSVEQILDGLREERIY